MESRVLPASAGMILDRGVLTDNATGAPRQRGDDPSK